MAADNKLLGQFNLEGIAPAPRGMPQIEVSFDIDANGIVHVSAKDKGTGKEQAISIKSDGGLSEDEIKRMVDEAAANAEADKLKRELAEAKNTAETAIFSIEKSLKEHGDKISEDEKKSIEEAKQALSDELAKADATAQSLKEKTDALSERAMKLGEAVYKAAQAEQAAAEEGQKKNEDGTVDADFSEKK
jgi:molecular chaperone DnaK